ncbi:hyaluronidase-1-like [Pristis pectinata]|uniref:hyaluronidase-1-like n=1 Tax=Pristis pectinata TaxID=685728 RepID=UPI00223CD683|nr:hyaluronidase-1-like [Pristis pectinata]
MVTSLADMTLTESPVVLLCMCTLTLGQLLRQTRVPIMSNKPFITVWNAPTAACKSSFGIDLNLGIFDIIANQNDSFIGQNITIFYEDKLGSYPHYTKSGVSVNGGTPQNASLKYHLMKAKVDVETLIPLKDFDGLSVIDWESWRPLWLRDWDQKDIYRKKSKQLVQKRHPDWSESQVAKQAQIEYEQAARDFMGQTLKVSKGLRPWGLWGYYGFPCCYNDVFTKNYTGECPDIEMKRNEQLAWLWKESIALYPSIYLSVWLRATQNTQRFVHYRIKEALRHAQRGANYSLPVLPYARIVYANTTDFLTEIDLVHSIGESVAMGAAGIVLWGNKDYAHSQESCLALKEYINGLLGNYIVNITNAAMICSSVLCNKHGRCVRSSNSPHAYLHLNPKSFAVKVNPSNKGLPYFLWGQAVEEDVREMADSFQCQCYNGWMGAHCEIASDAM